MAERACIITAVTEKQIDGFRGEIQQLMRTTSSTEPANLSRIIYPPRTLYRKQHLEGYNCPGLELEEGADLSLGLRTNEVDPLMVAFLELTGNISHGLVGKSEIYGSEIDNALQSARSLVSDASVRFGIIFDDQEEKGKLFIEHPVIPGISPELDLEKAREKRKADPRWNGEGGIYRIEEGIIHEQFLREGLNSSAVQGVDYLIDEQNPESGQRRRIWVDFWRDSDAAAKYTKFLEQRRY